MMRLLGRVSGVVSVVVLLIGVGVVSAAATGGSTTGPAVTLNHTTVAAGDLITVTLRGFTARSVTISICGNQARRGSADCNMVMSKGVRIDPMVTPTVTPFGVNPPPVGCPCLVRVSSLDGDEVAIAPITLTGHPIAAVVAAPRIDSPFVAVAVSARAAPRGAVGWFRSNLGGPARYEVTVTVKNVATEPLHQARLSGAVGRSATESLAVLRLTDPGEIGVGQTWSETVSVIVPAPSFGGLTWRVSVSGAGPTVVVNSTTRHRPVLLIVATMLLIVDVALVGMRLTVRRRLGRARAAPVS